MINKLFKCTFIHIIIYIIIVTQCFNKCFVNVTGRTRRETCGSIGKLYSKAGLQNKQGSFSGKQEQHGQDKDKS